MPRRKPLSPARADRRGAPFEVAIEALGAQGDGIARHGGRPVYVPLALPGDRLIVRPAGRRGEGIVAEVVATAEAAPRATPPCRHFGVCGGCQLQHLPDAARLAWQQAQVAASLARRGLAGMPIQPAVAGRPGSRRRARLAFARQGGRLTLGFRQRSAHALVDLAECPLLAPPLAALLPELRGLLRDLAMGARGGEVLASASDRGVDLLLETPQAPDLAAREALAAWAAARDLARLAWRAAADAPIEPLAARRPVQVTIAGIAVDLPPGAFLQASAAAEAAIGAAVAAALGEPAALAGRRLADLYAGCGALGLPFACGGATVQAFEAEPAMAAALGRSARAAGLGRVRASARDLHHAPLTAAELADFAAVILDPPRSGARNQAAALAGSAVPRIAMVSCNPATFARDARLLVDGGYRLAWVQLIDAFLWSSQIELVGAFERAGKA